MSISALVSVQRLPAYTAVCGTHRERSNCHPRSSLLARHSQWSPRKSHDWTLCKGWKQRSTKLNVVRPSSEQIGIIIVDHGSKRAESNNMLYEFVELYRDTVAPKIVEPAHMEIARPSILDAVEKCVSQGATKLVVAPYFLSRGRHIQQDIPALVAEAQKAFPEVGCTIADPIGIDPLMVSLINQRVKDALERSKAEPLAQK